MSLISRLHDRIDRVLRTAACDIGAAECHGMLCGALCRPAHFDLTTWLHHVSGGGDISPYRTGEPQAALQELITSTEQALDGGDYAFALMLPDDEAPLTERAQAFAAWCRGFLSGLGLAGIADLDALGEDAREFLADVHRFGMLASAGDTDEDDERALVELTEFTRMGVLLIRADLRVGDDAAEVSDRTH